MLDLVALAAMSDEELQRRAEENPEWLEETTKQLLMAVEDDRKSVQLAYYAPVNPDALAIHHSTAREVAIVGGNRSSKTDSTLAELSIQMTGHIPQSLMATYPREKIRAPIRARVVCNSLTDTLEPVIKPKLRWDQWNGIGDPKDGRGHWGWIPRHVLKGGTWETAWSEKYRTLYAAVDNYWVGSDGSRWSSHGTSTCQFLSYDQDLSAFAGSSMHFVMHDELPPADIYRENRMRTLDVKGQIYTAFTPPDEAGISRADVSWFHDEVYEPGLPGPHKHPDIDSIVLWTENNRILSQYDIQALAARLTEEQRETRLRGRFAHLSGVVYPLFTDHDRWWCFRCVKAIVPVDGTCATCTGDDIETFSHVVDDFEVPFTWPVVFCIDPHPRKKDAMGWFAVTPSDDLVQIGELEIDGTAADIKREVFAWEEARKVHPVKRLMDPNIATETNDKLGRGWNIRKAYDEVGLRCDLATDDINVGIQNVNELLRPDQRTRKPRLQIFRSCPRTIYGMRHWSWDDWTRQGDRDPKEKVRDRHKDFPDVVRYVANDRPSFHGYTRGLVFQHRRRR